MWEHDDRHRSVIDKLGIKPGHAIAFDHAAWEIDEALLSQALEQAGRPEAVAGEPADVVLVAVDERTDVVELLRAWRQRIATAGGVWLLSPKRGQPGYVDQTDLIAAGLHAEVVDNKVCSVSERVSAMRFVLRRDRRSQAWREPSSLSS